MLHFADRMKRKEAIKEALTISPHASTAEINRFVKNNSTLKKRKINGKVGFYTILKVRDEMAREVGNRIDGPGNHPQTMLAPQDRIIPEETINMVKNFEKFLKEFNIESFMVRNTGIHTITPSPLPAPPFDISTKMDPEPSSK